MESISMTLVRISSKLEANEASVLIQAARIIDAIPDNGSEHIKALQSIANGCAMPKMVARRALSQD